MTAASILADTHRWNHMDGWGGGWMWLWGTLVMVGLVAAVVWIARSAGATRRTPPTTPTSGQSRARDILAERYAHGELTTEEYRERLGELDRDDRR